MCATKTNAYFRRNNLSLKNPLRLCTYIRAVYTQPQLTWSDYFPSFGVFLCCHSCLAFCCCYWIEQGIRMSCFKFRLFSSFVETDGRKAIANGKTQVSPGQTWNDESDHDITLCSLTSVFRASVVLAESYRPPDKRIFQLFTNLRLHVRDEETKWNAVAGFYCWAAPKCEHHERRDLVSR